MGVSMAESESGVLGERQPAPSPPARGSGSNVSSPSWVRGGAPAAKRFGL